MAESHENCPAAAEALRSVDSLRERVRHLEDELRDAVDELRNLVDHEADARRDDIRHLWGRIQEMPGAF